MMDEAQAKEVLAEATAPPRAKPGQLIDPPDVARYAQRGDPPMSEWPGRIVGRKDLMMASGDPRDWFRYRHREQAYEEAWLEFADARNRRKDFMADFSWNQILVLGDYGSPTSTQRIGVVDEVAARQRGSDQRQQFVPRVRPPRGAAEVEVMADEFPQAQVLCKGGRQEQAGIGHQAVVVKDDADTVGIVLWQHLLGAPCFRVVFCFKTILPDSEEHPLASSRTVPKVVFRWIRA